MNVKTESFTPIEKKWPEEMKKELFADYDKTIRPCEDTKATTVNFGLTILKFDLVSIIKRGNLTLYRVRVMLRKKKR
jgi:hypothetical protein